MVDPALSLRWLSILRLPHRRKYSGRTGGWAPSYEFLSFPEDVYFAWLSFLFGAVVCIQTGSLIGLAFLTGGEGEIHDEISILSSFIGFGFGAGLLRITYMTVLLSLT